MESVQQCSKQDTLALQELVYQEANQWFIHLLNLHIRFTPWQVMTTMMKIATEITLEADSNSILLCKVIKCLSLEAKVFQSQKVWASKRQFKTILNLYQKLLAPSFPKNGRTSLNSWQYHVVTQRCQKEWNLCLIDQIIYRSKLKQK